MGPFDVTEDGVADQLSAPTVVSGTYINSGVLPFLTRQVDLDYANNTTYFSN